MTIQPPLLNIRKDLGIAILTFNRPEVHNALDTETVTTALSTIQELHDDTEVRVLVITGAGEAFASGGDIAEMSRKTPAQARIYSELGHTLMRSIERLDKPVIAAINGFCVGGGMEVALVADIRIASEKARFALPETILGIIPGWGALPRATRLVGAAITKELVFTGDLIDARRALEIGLINRVTAHDELMNTTLEMAGKLRRKSRFALARAKEIANASIDHTLPDAFSMEIDALVACFETGEPKEGMQAFLEKREPQFD